jgi:prophage antirepressor-like protein
MLDQNAQASAPNAGSLPVEFRFKDLVVRTVSKDDEPWFVAADVCKALGIKNTTRAIAPLDQDEKGLYLMKTLGGAQDLSVVNEFGLYRLILRSDKAKAKEFQRWVIHDVLPTIRKTGRYETMQDDGAPRTDPSENGEAIFFRNPGRYTVTVMPDGKTHVYRNELKSLVTEANEVDFSLLCHTLKQIDASWRRVQHLDSLQIDQTDGFALRILNSTIELGSQTADQFIGTSQYRKWDPA